MALLAEAGAHMMPAPRTATTTMFAPCRARSKRSSPRPRIWSPTRSRRIPTSTCSSTSSASASRSPWPLGHGDDRHRPTQPHGLGIPRIAISAEPGDLAALAQRILDGQEPRELAHVLELENVGQAPADRDPAMQAALALAG